MKSENDILVDYDGVFVDKEFLYFLLSCLIAQKNINRMSNEQRELAQDAISKAFEDGVDILKGVDFVPKSDILFRKVVIKLGEQYMKEYFGVKYDGI